MVGPSNSATWSAVTTGTEAEIDFGDRAAHFMGYPKLLRNHGIRPAKAAATVTDLQKAVWYVQRELQRLTKAAPEKLKEPGE